MSEYNKVPQRLEEWDGPIFRSNGQKFSYPSATGAIQQMWNQLQSEKHTDDTPTAIRATGDQTDSRSGSSHRVAGEGRRLLGRLV